ncbi:HNH endonuclease [Klebsiella pneumoniae]|nr:HNH endonuclease [Klebsiella pneumoniae]
MRVRKSIADVKDVRLLRLKFGRLLSKSDGSGCINWNGAINFYGYGQFSFEGRTWSAHRLAYEILNGAIPQCATKWWVLHRCDNPACCNPEHLYLGDAKDNAKDMIDRKRQRMGFKRHGGGEQVRFGRVFYEIGGQIKTLFEWAQLLNVNPCTLDQRISAGWPEKDLGLSSKAYKRHLKSEGQTKYRRFSGLKEVEDYKNKTPVAVTTEASASTNLQGNIDMTSLAKTTKNYSTFAFDDRDVRVVAKDGEPWFLASDLCDVLGLDATSIRKLDDDEKGLHSMQTLGGTQQMAVVSESGMWTLILRCRDAVKPGTVPYRVRKWVTAEVLPSIRKTGSYEKAPKAKKSLPGKITPEQQEAIKQLVMTRGKALPKENQAKAMITMWSSLKSHFGCSYKEISDDQFTEALSIAARVPLEGEFLGKQETLPAPKFDVNIPLQWWIDNNPLVRSGNLSFGKSLTAPSFDVTMEMLCGDNSTSAAIRLINVLEEAGFDVSAPKAEIVAMRKHLGNVEYGMKAIADACRRAGNKTISFRGGKAEYLIG